MWCFLHWKLAIALWLTLVALCSSVDEPHQQRIFYMIGRTGDGKSSFANMAAIQLGLTDQPVFSEGDSPTSHTTAPQAIANDQFVIVDTPGLLDHHGAAHDEGNMVEIVKHAKEMGYVHGFLLVINEQSPRFDSGMQDAVRLLVDTFGPAMLRHMGIIFTRATLRTPEETVAWMQSFRQLLSDRLELPLPHHIPNWRVDNKPEELRHRGVAEEEVERRVALNRVAVRDMRQWLLTLDALDVTRVVADEYEVTKRLKQHEQEVARLEEEAKEARRRADELALESERAKSAEIQREAERLKLHARDMEQRVANARKGSSYWQAVAIGLGIAIIAM
jgi:hypothetical protein